MPFLCIVPVNFLNAPNTMLITSIITFIISFISVNLIRRYLHQHLIDIPNDRSSHKVPTPRGGGLGFIIAFAIGLTTYNILSPAPSTAISTGLWLSLMPLVVISLLDDWKSLRATLRYAVQLSVSTLIVVQTGPFPQPWLQPFSNFGHILAISLTIIGITALINFYNFMDGLDGLVAGVSLIQISLSPGTGHPPKSSWAMQAAPSLVQPLRSFCSNLPPVPPYLGVILPSRSP
jgi:Fuc2NAc and GlcNAc transferase